nr:hypothetical protein GCM10020093_045730 [Planobispora longispora]
MSTAVSVRGLRMSYGSAEVLRGVDLEIRQGEIFTLLGPNGAGKTTTIEILEGFRKRSAGEVSVLGTDPGRAPTPGGPGSGSCCRTGATTPDGACGSSSST